MRKQLATAAAIAAATIVLGGCAQRHAYDAASDLAIDFTYSLAGHNGKFCDLLDSPSKKEVQECKKSEADLKAKQEADPQPIIWSPKIYQMMPGEGRLLGIAVEFNRAGNQEFVVIEAIRRREHIQDPPAGLPRQGRL